MSSFTFDVTISVQELMAEPQMLDIMDFKFVPWGNGLISSTDGIDTTYYNTTESLEQITGRYQQVRDVMFLRSFLSLHVRNSKNHADLHDASHVSSIEVYFADSIVLEESLTRKRLVYGRCLRRCNISRRTISQSNSGTALLLVSNRRYPRSKRRPVSVNTFCMIGTHESQHSARKSLAANPFWHLC